HHEALAIQRKEQLAAVGVVVGTPDERALARAAVRLRGRLLRPVTPAEQVAVAHGVVARVQRLALPGELEQALGHAPLITGVLVDGTPALRRPGHDLDLAGARLIDQAAVALEARRGRLDERRVMYASHAGRGHVGDGVRIDVHGAEVPLACA